MEACYQSLVPAHVPNAASASFWECYCHLQHSGNAAVKLLDRLIIFCLLHTGWSEQPLNKSWNASCLDTSRNALNLLGAGTNREPAAAPMHRRGHSTGSMHHRQLSAGTAVELGRAFDSLLSAAPTKGTLVPQLHLLQPGAACA